MAFAKAFAGSAPAGFPIRLSDGTFAYAQATVLVDAITGAAVSLGSGASGSATDLDTNGNPVPTYKAHTFTQDGSGNLATDTVTDGTSTWVRTYTYTNGSVTTDSGWVKQ